MKMRGLEGVMQVQAQLASAAMGSANVNAGYNQSSNSSFDHVDRGLRSITESHNYNY